MSDLLARFDDEKALADAIRVLRERGVRRLDASTPFASLEVERALAPPRSRIPWLVAAAAAFAVFSAWGVMYWTNAYDYPLDVGGRPLHSFWSDIPIMFESAILASTLTGFFAFFAASRLPTLHHPWFEVAVGTGFWLAIDAEDPAIPTGIEALLREHGATAIEGGEQ